MNVKICSAYSDKALEEKINSTIKTSERIGYYLVSVEYSTIYDEYQKAVLRSAVLVFEDDSEEDDEDEE